jgi:hypothetical protein
MADNATMLSLCDPLHIVVTKTSRVGDTSIVSSHYLDWRQVLASPESRCNINVELMGTGMYWTTLNDYACMIIALGRMSDGQYHKSSFALKLVLSFNHISVE